MCVCVCVCLQGVCRCGLVWSPDSGVGNKSTVSCNFSRDFTHTQMFHCRMRLWNPPTLRSHAHTYLPEIIPFQRIFRFVFFRLCDTSGVDLHVFHVRVCVFCVLCNAFLVAFEVNPKLIANKFLPRINYLRSVLFLSPLWISNFLFFWQKRNKKRTKERNFCRIFVELLPKSIVSIIEYSFKVCVIFFIGHRNSDDFFEWLWLAQETGPIFLTDISIELKS